MTLPQFGGPWTEQKLEILRRYLNEYTTVLKKQGFTLIYVDAFAGAGSYVESGDTYEDFHELRRGSAQIALAVDDRPFDRLVFIEKETNAASTLQQLANEHKARRIDVIQGDANIKVPEFCRSMGDFERAVVFLDPYATEVNWSTVEAIAATQKIDCWILFPLMAVARMMPTGREPDEATADRLDRIFGGREYWQASYRDSRQTSFWDDEPRRERPSGSEQIADRYRDRLVSTFERVAPTRRTLRNSRDVPLFELFFAASNPVGARRAIPIASYILQNW